MTSLAVSPACSDESRSLESFVTALASFRQRQEEVGPRSSAGRRTSRPESAGQRRRRACAEQGRMQSGWNKQRLGSNFVTAGWKLSKRHAIGGWMREFAQHSNTGPRMRRPYKAIATSVRVRVRTGPNPICAMIYSIVIREEIASADPGQQDSCVLRYPPVPLRTRLRTSVRDPCLRTLRVSCTWTRRIGSFQPAVGASYHTAWNRHPRQRESCWALLGSLTH